MAAKQAQFTFNLVLLTRHLAAFVPIHALRLNTDANDGC